MKFIMNSIYRFKRREDGASAIEMAIIFPILLIIYLSIAQIITLYSISKRVMRIANTIGDIVSQENTVNRKYLSNLRYLADATMIPYQLKTLDMSIIAYDINSKGVINKPWSWSAITANKKDEQPANIPEGILEKDTFFIRANVSTYVKTYFLFSNLLPNKFQTIHIEKVYYYRHRLGEKVICTDCSN